MKAPLALLPAVCLGFLAIATSRAQAPANKPFTVELVPSHHISPGGPSIRMEDKNAEIFYVILTNVSKNDQPVFEHWNGWGCRTLSFEITLPDGKKSVLFKLFQGFTVNYPSTFLVPPGEHQVFQFSLDKTWAMRPKLALTPGMKIDIKAIYEVEETPESLEEHVWCGRVESKPWNLRLRLPPSSN